MKSILLRQKLLVAVAALVIVSGLIVSLVVSQRYEQSLRDAAILQGRYLCQSLASEAADKILINDLVALQKLLFHHQSIDPSIAYLFVARDGEVLAHTFGESFPVELLPVHPANHSLDGHHLLIGTPKGDRFLDFAWPVLEGWAGTLRLGLSDAFIRKQMSDLWFQMLFITLLVLMVSMAFSLLCIGRITRPLRVLVAAVEQVDAENLDIHSAVDSQDEVGILSNAFNRMIARLRDYTRKLEANATELDRAYAQIRASFDILKRVGSQTALKDVSAYLINRFTEIVPCSQLALMVFSADKKALHVYAKNRMEVYRQPAVGAFYAALAGLEDLTFMPVNTIPVELLPPSLREARRLAVFPSHHENQLLGALMVACPGQCTCNPKGLKVIGLLLQETAGVLQRTIDHEARLLGFADLEKGLSEFCGIVGKDPQMRTLYGLIDDIAPTDASILIQGESGTGKELVARAIHRRSHRRNGPFVVINCSAYPATLLESELFGHERGAFSGAIRQKAGRFEQADGGTVFLDEVGEIPASAQVKLLRVLQTQKFERIGGETTLAVDVRIISATNSDLVAAVKTGGFREDLYYRLNVIPIHLPPLRSRRNDIPLLARHFMSRFAGEQKKALDDFASEAMAALLAYDWPGNVRELENAVEHAVVLAKSAMITVPDLPAAVKEAERALADGKGGIMEESEVRLLQDVLEACDWNKKAAARRLGISRNTLYRKLKKYRIQPPTTH
jgi:DNA-binding NtrC family response regulator/HAMP domain-containing protein